STNTSDNAVEEEEEEEESARTEAEHMIEPTADEEEFIQKYGAINVSYITPPKSNAWFTRPYALNYFHDGKLFRTRHERSSGKLELFLDLIYVGIVSNLASDSVKNASWGSILKFIVVFIPAWNIWCDLKEFMNSYFTDDMVQKGFVLWVVVLLIIYDNNCLLFEDDEKALRTAVVAYALARISFAGILTFYSLYIKEHRVQMRLFAASLVVTSCLWFVLFGIHRTAVKVGYCFIVLFFEQLFWVLSIHPWTKRQLKLAHSTALNIEHEDERFQSFFIIALGEFLFGLVSGNTLKTGLNLKLSKGISVLVLSFLFLGFYTMKDGSIKAVHALRRSATTAALYIYSHLILIAALLITGDSAVDLAEVSEPYLEHEELSVLIFHNTGIFFSMAMLSLIACLDKETEYIGSCTLHSKYGRLGRLGLRVPVTCYIFASSWLYERMKLNTIMWVNTILLFVVWLYEFCIANPMRMDELRAQFKIRKENS
ncbi:hypothetical protein WICPIJ_002924, partial [Wickerhamomyces pijperi]